MGRLIELLILMGLAAMVFPQGFLDKIPHERAYDCNPDPVCDAPDTVVADPFSCNSYYICMAVGKPTPIPIPCGPGKIFDVSNAAPDVEAPCIDDTGVCELECVVTCNVACENEGEVDQVIADYNDCGHFYECKEGGDMIEHICGAGKPYFNGVECTTTKASCCKPVCDVNLVCKGHKLDVIPDPNDCHAGIICANETSPIPLPCGSFIYDPAITGCSDSETECTDLCSETTGATGAGGETTPAGESTGAVETTPAGVVTTPAGGTTGAGETTPAGGVTTPARGTTVVTTTAAGTTSACLDSLDCSTANGIEFMARCTTCDQSYFQCKSSSGSATVVYCSGYTVFNPDPIFPSCIDPENCPFHPGK